MFSASEASVAVITGGSSGIGLNAARALRARGLKVYELSRRAENAEPGVTHLQADVTDETQVNAAVAEILRRESSVRDVILAATAADAAVVGIGAIDQRRDATILRSGYISEGEQLMYARKGAVGDILGYFLQADGRPVEGLEIHRELLGVTLDELAQLPTIVGVAGGEEKAQAIYAALIGKRINGLVTEETTARAVLTLAS